MNPTLPDLQHLYPKPVSDKMIRYVKIFQSKFFDILVNVIVEFKYYLGYCEMNTLRRHVSARHHIG